MNTRHETPCAERKFFCDAMLGRLAKWLRLLGCDTAYQARIDDAELLDRCRREWRILLTRDTHLMERRAVARGEVRALLLKENDWQKQLAEVDRRWPLQPQAPRCPVDNRQLEELSRQQAQDLVPPYVWETQERFQRCPACRRVYWRATHWRPIAAVRDRYR